MKAINFTIKVTPYFNQSQFSFILEEADSAQRMSWKISPSLTT